MQTHQSYFSKMEPIKTEETAENPPLDVIVEDQPNTSEFTEIKTEPS
jgi:hypothetical protein